MQTQNPVKIVMLGEGRVGKTSLSLRFCHGQFDEKQESSVNATYLEKTVDLASGPMKLAIWDTAGQEMFHAMTPMYYRDAQGAVLVYDITYKESFNKVERWINELRQFAKPDIEIVIAGNKCDMKNQAQIDFKEVEEYAKKQGAQHFLTSAKADVGIMQMYKALTTNIQTKMQASNQKVGKRKGLQITEKSTKKQEKKGGDCC